MSQTSREMSTTKPLGKLPPSADESLVKSWTINIAEDTIERMRTLVKLSAVPDECFENASPDVNRRYGVQRSWLIAMRDKWLNDFDWKYQESELNKFPHFKATISDPATSAEPLDIHFVGLFSSKSDAIPIILPHGWPGSFLEFIPILKMVQKQYNNDPSQLPYHIVVPSLPGFGFSSAPPVKQPLQEGGEIFGSDSISRIFNRLMSILFGEQAKYIAQGGDIGSRISRILASTYPNCVGTLLNYCPIPEPPRSQGEAPLPVTEEEKKGLERWEWFKEVGAAYAAMQSTKPSTLGLVLGSSPLAVLSWIGEKFLDWVDPKSFGGNPPYDSADSSLAHDILMDASLYWLTGHIATTFYVYKEAVKAHPAPQFHIHAPKMLGYSWFPMELAPSPVAWVATSGNLVWHRRHERGGHFAAIEQPQALWDDLQEFVEVVKQTQKL